MVPSLTLLHVIVTLSAISCEVNRDNSGNRKNDYSDKLVWKKEFEDELTDAMLSTRNKPNKTRVAQSALSENEDVIEKLINTFSSSEKYLKKIDSIDFRLNRLDIEVHEKTNDIVKRITNILAVLREQGSPDKFETVLDTLKNDVTQIKLHLEKNPRTSSGKS